MNEPVTPTRSAFVRRTMAYKAVKVHLIASERLVLQMMRHPTATDAQVLEVRDSYRKSWNEADEMRNRLKAKFASWREPWNMDEGITK